MTLGAAYYIETKGGERDPYNWVAESSRRARGFAIYAALRELGRDGLAEMIDRCCLLARRMADGLADTPGVTILNDVVLNQVLVRFAPPGADGDGTAEAVAVTDAFTREVIAAVQADGTTRGGLSVNLDEEQELEAGTYSLLWSVADLGEATLSVRVAPGSMQIAFGVRSAQLELSVGIEIFRRDD